MKKKFYLYILKASRSSRKETARLMFRKYCWALTRYHKNTVTCTAYQHRLAKEPSLVFHRGSIRWGAYFNTSMEGDVEKRVLYLLEANRTFGEMGPLPLPHRTLTIPMLAWESDHYNLLTAAREAVSIGVMVKTSGYPESPSVMGNPWHGKHKKQARKPDFYISLLPCLYGYRGNVQNT